MADPSAGDLSLYDRGALPAAAVIELFRSSRYLDLDCAREPTLAWYRPSFAGELSVDRVYRAADGALLGHVSVTRAYSRTWLGHQLSTRKGHRESLACRATLYRHFARVPRAVDGPGELYLLGYYDRRRPWHRRLFEGFVEQLGDPKAACTVGFDRFVVAGTSRELQPQSRAAELSVGPPAADELPAVLELIRAQLPSLAAAAFDLDMTRLASVALHPGFARRGLERGRRVVIVRERRKLAGVALCETGSADLSLANLFNLAQVYVTPGASQAARAALVAAVDALYRRLGVRDPVVVAPTGHLRDAAEAGLRLVESMGCIVWSGAGLDRYPSYLDLWLPIASPDPAANAPEARP